MTGDEITLITKMRTLAAMERPMLRGNLIRLTPDQRQLLARLADDLDAATDRVYKDGDATTSATRQLIGAWARARKCWCDLTGEDLA